MVPGMQLRSHGPRSVTNAVYLFMTKSEFCIPKQLIKVPFSSQHIPGAFLAQSHVQLWKGPCDCETVSDPEQKNNKKHKQRT